MAANNINPYEALGNAVVIQAAKDYREACAKLKKNPENVSAKAMKEETEKFFESQRFNMFTELDGKALLEALRKEVHGNGE